MSSSTKRDPGRLQIEDTALRVGANLYKRAVLDLDDEAVVLADHPEPSRWIGRHPGELNRDRVHDVSRRRRADEGFDLGLDPRLVLHSWICIPEALPEQTSVRIREAGQWSKSDCDGHLIYRRVAVLGQVSRSYRHSVVSVGPETQAGTAWGLPLDPFVGMATPLPTPAPTKRRDEDRTSLPLCPSIGSIGALVPGDLASDGTNVGWWPCLMHL